jgi:hypothetical protein
MLRRHLELLQRSGLVRLKKKRKSPQLSFQPPKKRNLRRKRRKIRRQLMPKRRQKLLPRQIKLQQFNHNNLK